ncbi:MAG: hypothetical protein ABIT58_09975, partial [Ferruginibacter sp.]
MITVTKMTKFIDRRFTLHYFALTVLFIFILYAFDGFYFTGLCKMSHAIDEHIFRTLNFSDTGYVILAKNCGYDPGRYFISYFTTDMLFPIIYSLFFLSIIAPYKKKPFYNFLVIIILVGCLFDYMENLTIAIFLCMKTDVLAGTVV